MLERNLCCVPNRIRIEFQQRPSNILLETQILLFSFLAAQFYIFLQQSNIFLKLFLDLIPFYNCWQVQPTIFLWKVTFFVCVCVMQSSECTDFVV